MPGEFLDVDPRSLHASFNRSQGADPLKLARQVTRYGASIATMPPVWVWRCKDGKLMIADGMTRATRAADLLPGQPIRAEVTEGTPRTGREQSADDWRFGAMMPVVRKDIIHTIQAMCRLFPSYRFCQMVANTAFLARGKADAELGGVDDRDFLNAMRESIRQREERLAGEPPPSYEGDTLPPLVPQIVLGLEELSQRYPELTFVQLVLQVAERAKEFAPFDFWDVEDADFLRALRNHLEPSTALTP